MVPKDDAANHQEIPRRHAAIPETDCVVLVLPRSGVCLHLAIAVWR